MQANQPIELFCSYAPEDTCWLNDLEAHLRSSTRQGLFSVWHEQRIAAGENKSQAMHIHLATADMILLLISSSFFTSENCYNKVMPYALERHQKQEALVIPILLRAVDWQQAPFGHLKALPTNGKPLALWEDKDAALTHVATHLRRLIEQKSLHTDAALEEISPYKGLLPYTEADSAFFFGHEVYLQQLLTNLQVEHRFLLILGPSSSGKTSLVQAGLIPLLRHHGLPGLTCTDFVNYIPHKPLLETWLALPIFNSAATAAAGLARWRQDHPHPARLVLIIDALEELFHCADKQERDNFVAQLEKIIQDDLATLLLIMRDDYYSDLATYETLIHTLERHLSNIPHLTVEMTRIIIEKPAQQVGLKIEGSLVNTIADDTMSTQAEPRRKRLHRHRSVLPLLSYTLTQLFQRREDFELTWQGYHDLGGIAGSLTAWATNTYLALSPTQQHLARHLFTALVVPGDENIGVPDHRQETFLAALARNEQEIPAVQEVVEQFTRAHLLECQYDPAHQDVRVTLISETLLHEWPFLQDWLREDRAYLSWHRPFLERVKQWHDLCTHASEERAAEVLLHEGELFTAQDWHKRYGTRWTTTEQRFLAASQDTIEHQKEQQRAYQQAQQEQHQLFARTLAMQALLLQEKHPERIELSILLAAEALKRHSSFEAKKAFTRGLQLLPQTLLHVQRTTSYTYLAASTDGSQLVAAGEDGLIWIPHAYDETTPRPFTEFRPINALALNADGTLAVLVYGQPPSCDAWIVDLSRTQPARPLHHSAGVIQILCRGNDVFTATESGTILRWRLADAALQGCFSHPGLTTMSLSPDESYLATASRDGTIKLWDIAQGVDN